MLFIKYCILGLNFYLPETSTSLDGVKTFTSLSLFLSISLVGSRYRSIFVIKLQSFLQFSEKTIIMDRFFS